MKNVRSILYCFLAVSFTASMVSSCKDGEDGKPGSLVTIENCEWYIDGKPTGINACGTPGTPGASGDPGDPGTPGSVVTIVDCYWHINNDNTGIEACGRPGSVVTIGADGYWYIDNVKTDTPAVGTATPPEITIGDDGYWWINGAKTDVKAQGPKPVITIGLNGNWYVDDVDTEVQARGPAGQAGSVVYIGDDGYWYIDDVKTAYKAAGSVVSIGENGNWWIDNEDTGFPAFVAPNIRLNNPDDNIGVLLYDDATFPMTFSWFKASDFTGYVLKFSTQSDFPNSATYTVDAGDVDQYVIDRTEFDVICSLPGLSQQTLYWTVEPDDPSAPARTFVRSIILMEDEMLNKSLFVRWNPDEIPYNALGGWDIENLWNGTVAEPGFSSSNTNPPLPYSFTFDMGQVAAINRIVIFPRTGAAPGYGEVYGPNHPKRMDIYGSTTSDATTWVHLGEFVSQKPSGSSDRTDPVDIAYLQAGEVFQSSTDAPVRYLRIIVTEQWGGYGVGARATVVQLVELDIFGVPEEYLNP